MNTFNKALKRAMGRLTTPSGTRFVEDIQEYRLTLQIHIDIPRTNPGIKLYQLPRIQEVCRREEIFLRIPAVIGENSVLLGYSTPREWLRPRH